MTGVYSITSPSGKCYVGSAVTIERRWIQHRSELRLGTHRSKALQSAWRKYGEENLKYKILLRCDPEKLLFYEQRIIDAWRPKYNSNPVAGSQLGARRSEECRRKMSEARRGKPWSEKRKQTGMKMLIGRKRSPEAVAKTCATRLRNGGYIVTREMIEKGLATKRANDYQISDETRRKLSIATTTAWKSGRRKRG